MRSYLKGLNSPFFRSGFIFSFCIFFYVIFNELVTLPFYTRFTFYYSVTGFDKILILVIAWVNVGCAIGGMYYGFELYTVVHDNYFIT